MVYTPFNRQIKISTECMYVRRPSFRNNSGGGGGGGGGGMSDCEKIGGRSHVSVFCFLDYLRWHLVHSQALF